MTVSEQEYLQLVLRDPSIKWELHCGTLVERPPMTWEHSRTGARLGQAIRRQLPEDEYEVLSEAGRLRRSPTSYYIPDVIVVPAATAGELFREPGMVAAFPVPLPFVAEVWSPSTGSQVVTSKIPEYQRRGDHEIWHIHPYERTVTTFVRQPDGSYSETLYRGSTVHLTALAGVAVDLDKLFAG
jgi:Uma2 family endonuclease